MRFDKKTRKLAGRKRRSAKRASGSRTFWWMLLGALVFMALFLVWIYSGHSARLYRIRLEKVAADMDRICVAAILFYQEHGRYPSASEGLGVLWDSRDSTPGASGPPFRRRPMDQAPLDPWGNPYLYQAPHGDTPLRLISVGADGRPGGEGEDSDVIREGCRSTPLGVE